MLHSLRIVHLARNGFWKVSNEHFVLCMLFRFLHKNSRFRSPKDFEEGDLRRILPRFSEDNFPKNLELVDKLKAIGDRYNASAARVTLAWILAEHSHGKGAIFLSR